MLCYINGTYLKEKEAKISVLDLGLIRGYGVFDYLRTYKKRPFHLWEHLLRLKYSVEQIGLCLPEPLKKIQEIILHLVEQGSFEEAGIKIIVTGGLSPDQLMPVSNESLIILVYPLKAFPKDSYPEGIKVITTPLMRSFPDTKTLQYTPAILALKQGKIQNAQEALYLNHQKEILEATTSNFFAFKKDTLITPSSKEILFGITREVVLNLAKDLFKIELRSIAYEELASLDETFLSSSNKEILPIIQIDNISINNSQAGPKTRLLRERFNDYTKQKEWPALEIPRYKM